MIVRSALPSLSLFHPLLLLVCCNLLFFKTNVAGQDIGGFGSGGELAAFDTQQFAQGVSHRQDICDRYKALNNGTMKLEDVLRGLKLNVVVGAYAGSYFNYNNETGIQPYGGIVAEIMDELAARAGFTWRDSFGIYDVPAGGENQTWTDLLVWSIDHYDLTIDWWAKSIERMNLGVAFLKEWYDSSIILISKENLSEEVGLAKDEINFFNWMQPFTPGVWGATVGTILLSGVVYQLIEWMSKDRRDRKFWVWFSDSLYLSSMNATQAYEYGTPRTTAAKLFGFSSALWGLILTATYTANLASLLVTSGGDDFGSIETMDQVAFLKHPVCVWGGTILDSHLQGNFPSAVRKPQKELLDVYDALNANKCFFAAETVQGWLEHKAKRDYNPMCKLKWVGGDRKVKTIGAGFVAKADSGVKCTSLVRDVIDFYMEQLVDEGFIQRAWEVENKKKQDLDCATFTPDLLTDFEDLGEECGGRRLGEEVRKRRMLQEVFLSTEMQRRRRMKVATKSAASAAGALDGGDAEGQQMEFGAMFGSFFVHWILMLLSLIVAAVQRFRKQKQYAAANKSTAKMFDRVESDDMPVETNGEGSTKELKQQIEALNEALACSNSSQTKLVDEQRELRNKIERLSKVIEKLVRGMKEEIPGDESLHSLNY